MKKTLIIAALTLALAASVSATGLPVAGVALDVGRMPDSSKSDRVAWFNDARFGMFIHWGIYSIPARGEWTYANDTWKEGEYEAFARVFNPTNYNPREWAKLAKRAGMKYAVLTTRHHDGFCMFDSHFTDYKITNTPYGKDIVREYVEAFRAEGLKVGFYHSLPDWTHPGYSDPETPDGIHGRPLHAPTPEEYAAIFIRRKRRHRIRIRKQDSASLLVRLTMTPH